MTGTFAASPSRAKRYLECQAESQQEGRSPDNVHQYRGKLRHEASFQHYWLAKSWTAVLSDPKYAEVRAELDWAINRPGLMPEGFAVVSAESEGIPQEFRHVKHGRPLFLVGLEEGLAIEGSMDLVREHGDDRGVLLIDDFKARAEEDHEIQALWYAMACSRMWPGYTEYRFVARYLLTGRIETYAFTHDDLAAALPAVLQLLRAMRDVATGVIQPTRTACRRCTECALRVNCPQYHGATQVTAFAPQLPSNLVDLLAYRDRLKAFERILEQQKGVLKERIESQLQSPAIIDGREWRMAERGGRYILNKDAARVLAVKYGMRTVWDVDADKFETTWQEVLKRFPEDAAELRKEYDACWSQPKYKIVTSKAVA